MFSMPSDVKALSFDIWKTLLAGNKAFTRPRLRLLFDLLGHPGIDVEDLREAYLQSDRYFDAESERLQLDFGLGDRLRMMYDCLGITSTIPGDRALRLIQTEVGKLRLTPGLMPSLIEESLPATLEALSDQGYTLGLLSNTGLDNEIVMEGVLKQLGIWDFFQVAMFSCADGRAKPNPGLFREMAKGLGVDPHQVLHIGDNPNADGRASEAGLHAVLYTPSGAPEGNALPFITSMTELVGSN